MYQTFIKNDYCSCAFWRNSIKVAIVFGFLISVSGCLKSSYNIETQDWDSLKVGYWLVNPDNSYTLREITITDRETIKDIQKLFSSKSVDGSYTANQPRLVLTLSDGTQWDIDMPQPNRLQVCQAKNKKISYSVKMNDANFSTKVREICLENEKTLSPNVVIDNIMLCNGGINNDIIETTKPYSP